MAQLRPRLVCVFQGLGDVSKYDVNSIVLPHPVYETANRYAVASPKDDKKSVPSSKLLEFQEVSGEHSSWFIDQSTEKNGALLVISPVDPLYLLLPVLSQAKKKDSDGTFMYCDLSQLLVNSVYPDLRELASCVSPEQLKLVCDVTEGMMADQLLVRLNLDKAKQWITGKLQRLVANLKNYPSLMPMQYAVETKGESKAPSATDDHSLRAELPLDRGLAETAMDLMGEYVSEETLCLIGFQLDTLCGGAGVETGGDSSDPFKDRKRWGEPVRITASKDFSQPASPQTSKKITGKKKPRSAGSKRMAAAARGSRTMSSFFGGASEGASPNPRPTKKVKTKKKSGGIMKFFS